MNLKNQIKSNRMRLSLSQEELAEKIYVTRQTVSNWETGKSYPDINSLLLLSSLFSISLDDLVKGDIRMMKEVIDKHVIYRLKRLNVVFTVALIVVLISAAPLMFYLEWIGFLIWIVIAILSFIPGLKIEKIKKQHDIQTYQEIVAFTDGQKLDEIQKAKESGKRIYQKIAYAIVSAIVSAIVVSLVAYIMLKFILG